MALEETVCGNVDGINLAQDRAQWWDLVNTVISFLFEKRRIIFDELGDY
jgi:hypothetical protein